jgi:site-specific recombinase XerC
MKLAAIDADAVARFVAELQSAGLAPNTIKGVLTPLSGLVAWALRRGMVAANPVAALERGERPRIERRERMALDSAEIGKLLDAARSVRISAPRSRKIAARGPRVRISAPRRALRPPG